MSLDELIRIGRQARAPTGAEDRVWAGLQQRLSMPQPSMSTHTAPGAARVGATKLVAGLVVAGMLGAGVLLSQPGPATEPEALSISPPEPEPAAPSIALVTPALDPGRLIPQGAARSAHQPPAARTIHPSARPKKLAAGSPPPPEPLLVSPSTRRADELRLIKEIRDARGQEALQKIDEHARRFGDSGQFVEARLAYKVDALCALGRVEEAGRVAVELIEQWPRSIHVSRVRRSCAGVVMRSSGLSGE